MSTDGVTFINVIEIPADQVHAFVAGWRERAQIMSGMPGFRDYRLHRAVAAGTRFQLVNVARWADREAFQAAMANPEFRAAMRSLEGDGDLRVAANPALYEVVAGTVRHDHA
ncbi:antibiotic biosynthesis monooxygenase family protein [Actinomadura violacea]|uniref:Antibiotic biosynthesis monooxygenase n=1 Tax=Actinomadura violacea TaxID=2819934 RepID=A0ABS3RHS4_9ACTN|nr:antibiotic biosynthesis monooxygenase family protein [Actinomadura violacea]MBO2456274.1 antibiotic biosynthesis monooxygenase [Actinomadura violacea]